MTETDHLDVHEYADDVAAEREAEKLTLDPDKLETVPPDEGDSGNPGPLEGGD